MQGHLTEAETSRRRREKVTVVALSIVLIIFTVIEIHLLKTSSKMPFLNSIFFFGLMNLNIVLIMLLLFLIFRNAVKLILDERSKKIGSKLKTRLVFSFILFSIIPTIFLFSISAFYIKSSFDKWFNAKVEGTLQRSIEVVEHYYENTKKDADHFARKIAFSIAAENDGASKLEETLTRFRLEYGLDGVEYYADPFAPGIRATNPKHSEEIPAASLETLKEVFMGKGSCRVISVGTGELIRCGAYIGAEKGVVLASYFIPMGLASQLSEINLTYADYKSNNPFNYPIKSTYFAILLMVTLLILFSATWTGFYVARRLMVPIEELVKGTSEVAKGNLEYEIPLTGNDELYRLIDSFNGMTKDLKQTKSEIEASHAHLIRVNDELSHRQRYIEVLLESVQSGVISLDENGRISMVNPAASELLRLSIKDLIGKPYWAIIPEDHRAEFRELLTHLYGTARPIRRELRVRAGSGKWITLLVTLSALRDRKKKQIGVVAVFDDVTEIQRMERMIAWREVAKRIAHEIKNPLTPIQLAVQRLRRRYLGTIKDGGVFDESTSIILKEVESLKTLVSEFSAFARLPEIQQVPDSLNEVIIEASNLFRAAHEKIKFDIELSDQVPSLQLDRAQLKRVLINLFDNAVDAMEGAGKISVATFWDREAGLVKLQVSDEGCGVTNPSPSQLFEPYYSTKTGGTGLGLAIVRRIINDHGGEVSVSANYPKGATFLVEFPESLVVEMKSSSAAIDVVHSRPGEETV